MKNTEFDQWLDDFRGRFPGKAKILQPATIRSWCEILADVELDKALWASRSLQDGSEAMPSSWDMIPAKVRQIARALASEDREQDGQVNCRRCNDSGIEQVRDTRKGRIADLCDCERGQKQRDWYETGNRTMRGATP